MKKNILLLAAITSCLLQASAYGMYAALRAFPSKIIKNTSRLVIPVVAERRGVATGSLPASAGSKIPVSQLSQVGQVAPAILQAAHPVGNMAKMATPVSPAGTLAEQLQPSVVPAEPLSFEEAIQQAINDAPEPAPTFYILPRTMPITDPIKPEICPTRVLLKPEPEYIPMKITELEYGSGTQTVIQESFTRPQHKISISISANCATAPNSAPASPQVTPQVQPQAAPLVTNPYKEFLKSGNIPAPASMPYTTATPPGATATNAAVAEGAQAAPILASFYSKITGNATAKAAEAQSNAALPMNRLCEIEHKPLTIAERCALLVGHYKYEIIAVSALACVLVGSYVAYKYYKAYKAYPNISPDDVD